MPIGLAHAAKGFAESPAPKPAKLFAPPAGFRAAEGVRLAWATGDGPFGRAPSRGGTAAQRAGRRYERKALDFLSKQLGGAFKPSQWFRFYDKSGHRWCQVDGLLNDEHGLVIFEVKYSFTADAWWQLRKLYEPVVKRAFLAKSAQLVVVCKNFDPATQFPEPITHTQLAHGWRICDGISVFQWRA